MTDTNLMLESFRAALWTEEKRLQELLNAIEMNDVTGEAVMDQIRQIEIALRKIRRAA